MNSKRKPAALLISMLSILIIIPPLSDAAGQGTPSVLIDKKPMRGALVGRNIELLADENGTLTIDQIREKPASDRFRALNRDAYSFGYSQPVYWVRFSTNNPTTEDIDWYLENDNMFADSIDLFVPGDDNQYIKRSAGDRHDKPYSKEYKVKNNSIAFQLLEKPGMRTYYMRFQTDGALIIALKKWSPEPFYENRDSSRTILSMFFGMLLVMIIYNACIFWSERRPSYLYFVLQIISLFMTQFILDGFASEYLWPGALQCNRVWLYFYTLSAMFTGLFTRSFLEMDRITPRLDRFVILPVTGIFGIEFIIAFLAPYRTIMPIITYSTLLLLPITILIGIVYLIKRSRQAIFFVTGYCAFIIGVCIKLVSNIAALPDNFFINWSNEIGHAIMFIVFSFGLADRIHIMHNELIELNTNLEGIVQQRTAELEAANTELEAINTELGAINEDLSDRQKRAELEMKIAVNVQRGLYPKAPPETDEWDIAYIFRPFAGVSGDLYDFYMINGTLRGISLFDISGHGISAGLITMLARSIIHRNFVNGDRERLNTVIENINRDITAEIGAVDSYLTGILLRMEAARIEYVNAAHTKMLYRVASSKNVYVVEPKDQSVDGSILGVQNIVTKFRTVSFSMNRGDSLFLYSDGLVESANAAKEAFGIDRLMDSLRRTPAGSSREMVDFIMSQFTAFLDGRDPGDDLTAIAVQRK